VAGPIRDSSFLPQRIRMPRPQMTKDHRSWFLLGKGAKVAKKTDDQREFISIVFGTAIGR